MRKLLGNKIHATFQRSNQSNVGGLIKCDQLGLRQTATVAMDGSPVVAAESPVDLVRSGFNPQAIPIVF